jgi:ribonuclease P protein component
MKRQSCKNLKLDRLKKRSDFVLAAQKGDKWVAKSVVTQCLQQEPHITPAAALTKNICCGFTATKKLGNAVIRNRVKRRLRAAAHDALHGATFCDQTQRHNLVFIGRAETLTLPYDQIVRDIRWSLKRLGVLTDQKAGNSHAK